MKEKKLLWSAGKFVYQKGSEDPLLYMPLQDFLRHTTEELCYLVLLRSQQERYQVEKINNTDLFFWIKRNSVEEIYDLIKNILISDKSINKIFECYCGIGLTYEKLKFLKKRNVLAKNFKFIAYEDEEYKSKFISIHQNKIFDPNFIKINQLEKINFNNILKIFNFDSLIKRNVKKKLELESLINYIQPNTVFKIRVNIGSYDESRTTIDQRNIELPSIKKVCKLFSKSTINYKFKFLDKFDDSYFLPEKKISPTGLLIIFNTKLETEIPGYEDFIMSNIKKFK